MFGSRFYCVCEKQKVLEEETFFFLDDWFFCVCLCFNPHFDHKRLKCTTILLQIKLKAWIVSSRGVFIRGKCYNWCVSDRKLHFISIWYTRLFTLLHSLCSHGHYQIFSGTEMLFFTPFKFFTWFFSPHNFSDGEKMKELYRGRLSW